MFLLSAKYHSWIPDSLWSTTKMALHCNTFVTAIIKWIQWFLKHSPTCGYGLNIFVILDPPNLWISHCVSHRSKKQLLSHLPPARSQNDMSTQSVWKKRRRRRKGRRNFCGRLTKLERMWCDFLFFLLVSTDAVEAEASALFLFSFFLLF